MHYWTKQNKKCGFSEVLLFHYRENFKNTSSTSHWELRWINFIKQNNSTCSLNPNSTYIHTVSLTVSLLDSVNFLRTKSSLKWYWRNRQKNRKCRLDQSHYFFVPLPPYCTSIIFSEYRSNKNTSHVDPIFIFFFQTDTKWLGFCINNEYKW